MKWYFPYLLLKKATNWKHNYLLVYSCLSLLVVIPFFGGYVFLLDWIGSPNFNFSASFYGLSESISAGLPLLIGLNALSSILGGVVAEKILMFLIFFLSAVSMHSLVKVKSGWARYFAGFIYAINPFVYERFISGQWHILLAYSVFPFAVFSAMSFFDGRKKSALMLSVWITLLAILNIHALVIFGFFFLVMLFFDIAKKGLRSSLLGGMVWLTVALLFLNSFWFLPFFTSEQTSIDSITSNDLAVFRTSAGSFNPLLNTAMLYGFWREDAYLLPVEFISPYAYIPLFGLLLFISVLGFFSCKSGYRFPVLIGAIAGQVLAVGISSQLSRGIFLFVFEHFSFVRGFREPEKFVLLIAFAFAFFSAYGVDSILMQFKGSKFRILAAILLVAIPFLYTPVLFGSLWGQVHPSTYPDDWSEVKHFLENEVGDFHVLFLPWHLYMDFHWINNSEKRISNPAKAFFGEKIISGDNMEIGRIYTSSRNPRSRYIDSLKWNMSGKSLANLGISYVLLAKDADFRNYSYLFNVSDLVLLKSSGSLYLFRNSHNVSFFYQADSMDGPFIPLGYSKLSPVKYNIDMPEKKYVIFAGDTGEYWQLGNQEPILAGPFNAYEFRGDYSLKYVRFNVYIFSYFISMLSLFAVLLLLFF